MVPSRFEFNVNIAAPAALIGDPGRAAILMSLMDGRRRTANTPTPELAEWKFERGGGLQVYQLKARAGSSSVSLVISSLQSQMEGLRKIGIDPGQPLIDGRTKVVMIKDLDGNSLAFVETT